VPVPATETSSFALVSTTIAAAVNDRTAHARIFLLAASGCQST
jgi:hypothetical protein